MKKIAPARCTGTFLPELLDDPNYIAEPKLDGARYMLYLNEDGSVNLYSRRNFPTIDKSVNVPHFAKRYPGLEGTVLDGEVMHPKATKLGDTSRILLMLPTKAVKEQEKTGKLAYHVFDILYYQGEDVRSKSFRERRKLLELTCLQINNPDFIWPVTQSDEKGSYFRTIINDGGEGVVLKNLGSSYGIGWVKCKRRSDFSTIITGFQEGNGKYVGNLGALLFSVYKDGTLYEIGKCSGMTDAERTEIWNNRSSCLGRVIDVFAQEVTQDGRLRHPVWHRFRNDVDPKVCTWEKTIADAKACGVLTYDAAPAILKLSALK